jgi:hypothetical protein
VLEINTMRRDVTEAARPAALIADQFSVFGIPWAGIVS